MMRSADKLKVQTTQDGIDCNYKIVTFLKQEKPKGGNWNFTNNASEKELYTE